MRRESFGIPLNLIPVRPAIGTLIYAGARTGKNMRRIVLINRDTHHVGIVDHTLMNRSPILAAVDGFPWQMIRACVNCVGIVRVNGRWSPKLRRSSCFSGRCASMLSESSERYTPSIAPATSVSGFRGYRNRAHRPSFEADELRGYSPRLRSDKRRRHVNSGSSSSRKACAELRGSTAMDMMTSS